jgi:MFS family permease
MSRSGPYRATAALFAVHGVVGGTLATRMPWIQDHLGLSAGELGLALLFPVFGAVAGMPTAGWLAHRFGGRTVARVFMALWSAVLALPAPAPGLPWLCAAMLLYGAAGGMAMVAMNAHAVTLERYEERPIMSGLHGLWCVGSLAGGGIGVLAAQAEVDARLHFGLVALVLLALSAAAGPRLLADRPVPGTAAPRRFALPTRPLLGIALIAFCAAYAEGAATNWSAVYLTKVTDAGDGVAAASYTIFMCCMAAARLAGDRLVARLGPAWVVRCGGALATTGALLVVVARMPALAIAGFALLGIGIATGVPLAMAAAGNVGTTPAEGVAGVAPITYLAVLIAPAVTGWTAGAVSYPFAFVGVAAVLGVLTLAARALPPRGPGDPGGPKVTPQESQDSPVNRS